MAIGLNEEGDELLSSCQINIQILVLKPRKFWIRVAVALALRAGSGSGSGSLGAPKDGSLKLRAEAPMLTKYSKKLWFLQKKTVKFYIKTLFSALNVVKHSTNNEKVLPIGLKQAVFEHFRLSSNSPNAFCKRYIWTAIWWLWEPAQSQSHGSQSRGSVAPNFWELFGSALWFSGATATLTWILYCFTKMAP